MNDLDFTNSYWKNYILLEKEFAATLNYVSLDMDNYSTFSSSYLKLILQIGSEIDVVTKALCNYYDETKAPENMNAYKDILMEHESDFYNIEVKIISARNKYSIKPWEAWEIQDIGTNVNNPTWWKVYNKVKHHRNSIGTICGIEKEYFKFANLEYTLFALAGLYQLLIYFYYELAKDDRIQTPLPGSRIFNLSGNKWNNIIFYHDSAFYINDSTGHLHHRVGAFSY